MKRILRETSAPTRAVHWIVAVSCLALSACDRTSPTVPNAPQPVPLTPTTKPNSAGNTPSSPDVVPVQAVTPDAGASEVANTPSAQSSIVTTDPAAEWNGFLGGSDDTLLRLTCNAAVEKIERNRGGSTISFRVWFADGARGLYKPQQTNSVANFRAELAAYRLSKLLKLNRVPPSCGRTMTRDQLQRTADASGDAAFSDRVMKELLARGDNVPGAMLYWVPGPLENVPLPPTWKSMLDGSEHLPDDLAQRQIVADLSRLIVFDFLIDNIDRWSGGNILRQHLRNQEPSPMLFMDNGASFTIGEGGLGARPREQSARMGSLVRFSRGLIERLRTLQPADIKQAMGEDPLGTLLTDAQIEAVLLRRDRVLDQVKESIQRSGEADTLVFP